jgi:hypothetical protein
MKKEMMVYGRKMRMLRVRVNKKRTGELCVIGKRIKMNMCEF